MRLIDGNKIVMSLADWWYSSFGQEETEESKAVKKVMDQVEKMVMEMPEIVRCKDCKTRKLNNPDDSLFTKDSEACKEQESKLDTDFISRQAAIELACWRCKKCEKKDCEYKDSCETMSLLEALPSEDPKPPVEDMGEVSDGYHTFNQLYHQRAVLFATIVKQNKDKAWKSWKHEDGKFCFDKGGEWFIVGVDTPEGSYTYHYEKKYWDMFDCEELDRGKHWDGHTEDDVTRLLSLPPVDHVAETTTDCISRKDAIEALDHVNIPTQAQREYAVEIFENIPPVEPKPVCEDAISRADTIKAMCSECEVFPGDDMNCADCTEVAVVRGMPPVEPKRPKGEWVRHELWNMPWYTCSECNFHGRNDYKFCPNCGADMRGDKE